MERKRLSEAKNKKLREKLLAKMLSIIRKIPGIRPSELNTLLNRAHSWSLRSTLIERGLVRKERKGSTVRYYPKSQS